MVKIPEESVLDNQTLKSSVDLQISSSTTATPDQMVKEKAN